MAKRRRERHYLKKSSTERSQLGEDIDRLLMLAFAGVVIYWIVTSNQSQIAANQPQFQYRPY